MKRMIACLLALVLTMSLAVCVAAEEVKTETTEQVTTEAPEIQQNEEMKLDSISVKQYAEEETLGEIGVKEYAEEETLGEISVKEYAEEETGFFGWLKNLWKSILSFFGL